MKVLSIHFGHDSSAAIVSDGVVIAAAQEERFTRLKHYSQMPIRSIEFCLKSNNLKISDIDLIVIPALTTRPELTALLNLKEKVGAVASGESVKKDMSYWIKFLLINIIQKLHQTTLIQTPTYISNYSTKGIEVINIEHHLAHAASAYYSSGFKEETLVFTADGSGDGQSLTIWKGKDSKLESIYKVGRDGSLGAFYSTVTEALGWIVGDGEGKVMGLAPYGNTKKTKGVLDFIRPVYKNGKLVKKYNWGWPGVWFDMSTEHWHFAQSENVQKLIKKYGAENIAAEAQHVLEDELVNIISYWLKKTGCKYLASAGGVMLNVKANQRIWETGLLKNMYVFPDSGDGGVAVGAALYGYYLRSKKKEFKKIDSVYWGPSYTNKEIEDILKVRNISYKKFDNKEMVATVSKLLSKGKIVGWFQGKMEVGPRALGNRSILMDPRDLKNKDIINSRVKYREGFRPFCPSIIDVAAKEYLENIPDAHFMIVSSNVNKDKIKNIPAVTHVDGSARPQVVTKKINPLFYDLIKSFGDITGVPVLLNTSFNIKGEPVVCTPQDAIKCFFDTGLDYLSMGNFLIKK